MPDVYQKQLPLSEFSMNYNSELLLENLRDRHNQLLSLLDYLLKPNSE